METLTERIDHFVSEINRRLIRTKEPYKTEDGEILYLHVYHDKIYHVDKAKKFFYIRDNDANQHFPNGYTFVKIDSNGFIYLPNGKKSVGSVYSDKSGCEYLDTLNYFEK